MSFSATYPEAYSFESYTIPTTDYEVASEVITEAIYTDQSNLIFDFTDEVIETEYEFVNCDNLTIIGGTFTVPLKIVNSKNIQILNVTFDGAGSVTEENVIALSIFGDCTGFSVDNCTFQNITAGVVSSDGFIHSYGLFVNRLDSSKKYSTQGTITNCTFENISTFDTESTKGDGDAIFIQAPPYIDDAGETVTPISDITIQNCSFNDCKKRGIKLSCIGTTVEDCVFTGEYWLACIELQYGGCSIIDCDLTNNSNYTESVTSCIVVDDGGFTIDGCTMSASYITEDGEQKYHPAIRFNSRIPASIFSQDPWAECYISNCYFDEVSRAIYAYDGAENPTTYTLEGLYIEGCTIGTYNQKYAIELLNSKFSSIQILENNTDLTFYTDVDNYN